ncbi:carboxymuconolactone decarboxylase family protein [Sphingomonas morindae]|uniref:Carboxymuconolactone decarboxylase family protein n=1 Tax=Sphingomonas morindae TaxID=1541170 RepID=A0ABY4X3P1_9SPHN|nr:carboxymuconolactone decarboxylase family protein [Sphingomonas morindae]USI71523.1 carboxymuconolactone decarboxylase family protein [Sphingomonas morindae]
MTDTPATARQASSDQVRAVSPALEAQTQDRVVGALWSRPGLSPRDRSLVAVAALIAGGQTGPLGTYTAKALRSGVTPDELSETVLHLAYYAGWAKALAATVPIAAVFAEQGIGVERLPAEAPKPLPLDEAAEARRKQTVGDQFGAVAPGLVDYTTDYLFRDLWLRPDLSPRDRSLVTVAALVATGQVQQITFHLGRAMDNGLTREEAAEVVTQLAFYTGWPSAMSALPVFKDVFEKRES